MTTPTEFDYDRYTYFTLTVEEGTTGAEIMADLSGKLGRLEAVLLGQLGEITDEWILRLSIPTNVLLGDPEQLDHLLKTFADVPGIRHSSVIQSPTRRSKRALLDLPAPLDHHDQSLPSQT
ncbi:hypothetical protein MJO28_012519 [Puccinia striiformis f. sp. tritici]|uniref:Uncharacterized protein n=2 Tax=Puccinia striiformis TaxID=27350 RepID=A0A2S4V4L8_9BASI|nr:hypothetical protein Pst134EB_023475 [Puccinia striiformis f. sp. tritici]KAI7942492.1 hypothetical protein MJO28_012519 [Puccinia striiformis f. sp. tritici]KAI9611295.1 hypothetical protein KEM48_004535 [Puccinia striiformis f. sp. tritici PST-130]POW04482.1 hypothetical protein PSHT_11210 [Puccinia striiformis]